MTEPTPPLTVALADFISGASVDTLPPRITERAALHVLDTLGCALAFADLPWSAQTWAYVRSRGTHGPATVIGHGERVSPELAAFANAAFAHGFETDDTEMRTASHPGVVVVPAALALAQQQGASGAQFLAAVVAGYETMIRVGLGGVGMMARGFHSTAVAGPFGAAAAGARLLGLGPEQTAHALGICASMAGGITEYAVSGGSVKRLHAAFAAQSGVEAAGLAAAGVTAPVQALEGRRGLFGAISAAPDPAAVVAGLGTDFALEGTGFKAYSCCAAQHSVIDAVADLQQAHGFTAADVAEVHVRQNTREFDVVGRIRRPSDVTSAQFSAAFGIALRLVTGSNGARDYLDAVLDEPALLAVVDKVRYERAEEPIPGDGPCAVRIRLADGAVHEMRVHHARGTAGRPLTPDEVIDKFRRLVAGILSAEETARTVELVLGLPALADLGELTHVLARTRGA